MRMWNITVGATRQKSPLMALTIPHSQTKPTAGTSFGWWSGRLSGCSAEPALPELRALQHHRSRKYAVDNGEHTRPLACFDRRPAGRNRCAVRSLNGDAFGCTNVVGEGADHSTRGRARSPLQMNGY